MRLDWNGRGARAAGLVLLAGLAGCMTGGPAPVSDRQVPGRAARVPAPKPEPKADAMPGPAPVPLPPAPAAMADDAVVVKPLFAPDAPVHVVKPGDTLFSIAKSNGVQVRDLIAWNQIEDSGSLTVGQQIRLAPPGGLSGVPVAPSDDAGRAIESVFKTQPQGQRIPYSEQAYARITKAAPEVDVKPEVKSGAKPDADTAAKTPARPEVSPQANSDAEWIWPTQGKVVAGFNEGSNKGINIAGRRGQGVFASADGRVIFSGNGPRGFGRLIVIRHPKGYQSVYAHNDKLLVKEGSNVKKGQRIAEMGSTDSESVKLHFEIRRQGKPVDPAKLLPGA